jgi:hypothetical protein
MPQQVRGLDDVAGGLERAAERVERPAAAEGAVHHDHRSRHARLARSSAEAPSFSLHALLRDGEDLAVDFAAGVFAAGALAAERSLAAAFGLGLAAGLAAFGRGLGGGAALTAASRRAGFGAAALATGAGAASEPSGAGLRVGGLGGRLRRGSGLWRRPDLGGGLGLGLGGRGFAAAAFTAAGFGAGAAFRSLGRGRLRPRAWSRRFGRRLGGGGLGFGLRLGRLRRARLGGLGRGGLGFRTLRRA